MGSRAWESKSDPANKDPTVFRQLVLGCCGSTSKKRPSRAIRFSSPRCLSSFSASFRVGTKARALWAGWSANRNRGRSRSKGNFFNSLNHFDESVSKRTGHGNSGGFKRVLRVPHHCLIMIGSALFFQMFFVFFSQGRLETQNSQYHRIRCTNQTF